MADILTYFREVNAQKQINKLAKKYKNKKIVIYGAGEYFRILKENYDLSKLNIVGIADKKFEINKGANIFEYTPLAPDELKGFDLDTILVALYDDVEVCEYLEMQILVNTKNKNKEISSIIEPTFWYAMKILLMTR